VVVARELGVAQSYTLEASFSGFLLTRTHFSVQHLHRMGQSLGDAVAEHIGVSPKVRSASVYHGWAHLLLLPRFLSAQSYVWLCRNHQVTPKGLYYGRGVRPPGAGQPTSFISRPPGSVRPTPTSVSSSTRSPSPGGFRSRRAHHTRSRSARVRSNAKSTTPGAVLSQTSDMRLRGGARSAATTRTRGANVLPHAVRGQPRRRVGSSGMPPSGLAVSTALHEGDLVASSRPLPLATASSPSMLRVDVQDKTRRRGGRGAAAPATRVVQTVYATFAGTFHPTPVGQTGKYGGVRGARHAVPAVFMAVVGPERAGRVKGGIVTPRRRREETARLARLESTEITPGAMATPPRRGQGVRPTKSFADEMLSRMELESPVGATGRPGKSGNAGMTGRALASTPSFRRRVGRHERATLFATPDDMIRPLTRQMDGTGGVEDDGAEEEVSAYPRRGTAHLVGATPSDGSSSAAANKTPASAAVAAVQVTSAPSPLPSHAVLPASQRGRHGRGRASQGEKSTGDVASVVQRKGSGVHHRHHHHRRHPIRGAASSKAAADARSAARSNKSVRGRGPRVHSRRASRATRGTKVPKGRYRRGKVGRHGAGGHGRDKKTKQNVEEHKKQSTRGVEENTEFDAREVIHRRRRAQASSRRGSTVSSERQPDAAVASNQSWLNMRKLVPTCVEQCCVGGRCAELARLVFLRRLSAERQDTGHKQDESSPEQHPRGRPPKRAPRHSHHRRSVNSIARSPLRVQRSDDGDCDRAPQDSLATDRRLPQPSPPQSPRGHYAGARGVASTRRSSTSVPLPALRSASSSVVTSRRGSPASSPRAARGVHGSRSHTSSVTATPIRTRNGSLASGSSVHAVPAMLMGEALSQRLASAAAQHGTCDTVAEADEDADVSHASSGASGGPHHPPASHGHHPSHGGQSPRSYSQARRTVPRDILVHGSGSSAAPGGEGKEASTHGPPAASSPGSRATVPRRPSAREANHHWDAVGVEGHPGLALQTMRLTAAGGSASELHPASPPRKLSPGSFHGHSFSQPRHHGHFFDRTSSFRSHGGGGTGVGDNSGDAEGMMVNAGTVVMMAPSRPQNAASSGPVVASPTRTSPTSFVSRRLGGSALRHANAVKASRRATPGGGGGVEEQGVVGEKKAEGDLPRLSVSPMKHHTPGMSGGVGHSGEAPPSVLPRLGALAPSRSLSRPGSRQHTRDGRRPNDSIGDVHDGQRMDDGLGGGALLQVRAQAKAEVDGNRYVCVLCLVVGGGTPWDVGFLVANNGCECGHSQCNCAPSPVDTKFHAPCHCW